MEFVIYLSDQFENSDLKEKEKKKKKRKPGDKLKMIGI